MKPLRYFIIFFLAFLAKPLLGQNPANDVIITKKGEYISCTIIKLDTAKVYFKVGGNVGSIEVSKPLSEVQEIKYAPKEMPAMAQPSTEVQKDDYVPANTPTVDTQNKKMVHPKQNNCLSFFAGLAYPVGPFNQTHLDTNQIGPAVLGQAARIHFTHNVKKELIVGVSCFYSVNQLNTKPITEKYKYNTDSVWTADQAQWRAFGIHLSLGFHKRFNDDVSVYGNIYAGYLSLKYPEVTLRVSSFQYLKFNTATSDAVSFGLGAGVNYRLFQSLGASANISFIQAHCTYHEILIQGESPFTISKRVSQTLRNVNQNYQNVFVTLGVNYWF
jgi:hypothetical protein